MSKMEWKDKEKEQKEAGSGEGQDKEEQEKKVNPPKRRKFENHNLDIDKMKKILDEADADPKYEDYYIAPVIIPTMPPGSNRYYVIRSLGPDEMEEVEELFKLLQDEEVKKAKEKATGQWKKSKNYSDEDAIPDEEMPQLDEFVNLELAKVVQGMLTRVNDLAVTMVGVVYPKDYREKATSNKIPSGDLHLTSTAIQVASGWSGAEQSIDVYEQAMIEGAEMELSTEEEMYRKLDR